MEEVTEIIPESKEIIQTGIYCIKCRSHTDNINEREDVITSKDKPRNVIKADCAICGKKKNRFVKSVKPIEDLVEKPIKVKQIRAKRVDELIEEDKLTTDGKTPKKVTFNLKKSNKKLMDALLEKYMAKFELEQNNLNQ